MLDDIYFYILLCLKPFNAMSSPLKTSYVVWRERTYVSKTNRRIRVVLACTLGKKLQLQTKEEFLLRHQLACKPITFHCSDHQGNVGPPQFYTTFSVKLCANIVILCDSFERSEMWIPSPHLGLTKIETKEWSHVNQVFALKRMIRYCGVHIDQWDLST